MAGWQTRPVAEVCTMVTDGSHFSPPTASKGYPYITVRDIKNGQIDFESCAFVSETSYDELRRNGCSPTFGDVLFSKDGTVGKVALVTSQRAFVVLSSLAILRPNTSLIDPAYLSYVLVSPAFLRAAIGQKTGVAIRRIILKNLKKIPVSYPPLPEQRSIVAILDEAFEAIDRIKANTEKNLRNARELFEASLQYAFGSAPKGVDSTTLGAVCRFVGGSQPPKSEFITAPRAGYVRLIQIRDYKSDAKAVYIPRALARRFCTPDDVMIGRYGPPLFQILRGLEGAYNVALMKAAPNESVLSKGYLYYFLRHCSILDYIIASSARAAGQIGLNKETIEPYPIYVPCLQAQAELVSRFEQLEAATGALVHTCELKLAALDELKKSLLHQALAGQLTAKTTNQQLEAVA
jgi:type I restriction enzyme S subunit